MNWAVAVGVAFVVLVLAYVVARLWWNLAHKAAPYRDDQRPHAKSPPEDVVVIKDD
jgi:hypothetical protein